MDWLTSLEHFQYEIRPFAYLFIAALAIKHSEGSYLIVNAALILAGCGVHVLKKRYNYRYGPGAYK